MSALLAPINRSRFARLMGVATVCAAGLGAGLATIPETATPTATAAVAALVLLSVLPSLFAMLPGLISDEMWGMAVLGSSGIRTMLAMGAMMMLTQAGGLPKEPVVWGLLGGAMALTLVEAGLAVAELQRREAARASSTTVDQPGAGDEPAPETAQRSL